MQFRRASSKTTGTASATTGTAEYT